MAGANRSTVQRQHDQYGHSKQRCTGQHQAGGQKNRVGHAGNLPRAKAAGQSAQCAAYADEREQPLALIDIEYVDHEGPEYAGCEKIDDAEPDIESITDDPRCAGLGVGTDQSATGCAVEHQQAGEDQQAENDKKIGHRNESPPVQPADDSAESDHEKQCRNRGHNKQPAKLVHATGHAHGITDRAQKKVTTEQAEKECGR